MALGVVGGKMHYTYFILYLVSVPGKRITFCSLELPRNRISAVFRYLGIWGADLKFARSTAMLDMNFMPTPC